MKVKDCTFTLVTKLYFLLADETRLRMRKRPNSRRCKTGSSVSQPNTSRSGKKEEICDTSGRDDSSHETLIVASVDHFYSWTNTPEVIEHQSQQFSEACQTVDGKSFEGFHHYRRLSEKEIYCLKEIEGKFVAAMETVITGFSETLDEVKDFLNTSMIWAKKLVTYVKSVEDFKLLSKEAQVLSIKSCVRGALTLIAAYRLDVSKNSYFFQGIYVSVDMFMRAFSSHKDVAELFVKICFSMQDFWCKDACLHAIFHLILLFNPDGEELLERELMSDLQNKYIILLKHYLESKYSYNKSKEYFAKILKQSRELRTLSLAWTEVLMDTDPQKIDPLTKEVYSFENICTKQL